MLVILTKLLYTDNRLKVKKISSFRKSHNLVSEVKDLFDIYDYCFDPQSMNEIKSSIDEVADNILDRNCRKLLKNNYKTQLL